MLGCVELVVGRFQDLAGQLKKMGSQGSGDGGQIYITGMMLASERGKKTTRRSAGVYSASVRALSEIARAG